MSPLIREPFIDPDEVSQPLLGLAMVAGITVLIGVIGFLLALGAALVF